MSRRITVAFDVGDTEVYERVGKADAFTVRLTPAEALWMYEELEEELLESDWVNDDVKEKLR